MKQMVVDGDTPFLPQEIITNILKGLPVRSLFRFQCVCKHWRNLFETPSFIEDHLHRSNHYNPLLLFQWNSRDHPLDLYLLDRDMEVREVQNAPQVDSLLCVKIMGSSNGLLCVEIDDNGISLPSLLLWNPAIRGYRHLPRTINDFTGRCHLGFGFSPIVNDYKIVRIYVLKGEVYLVNRVEVYSLCSGLWREVEFGNLKGVWVSSETVTANGAMFWFGFSVDDVKDYGYDLIVSFDIGKEEFTLIPMPDLDSTGSEKLSVYENKLALLSSNITGEDEYCVELWVMEDGTSASEERWSWSKKYTSSPCPCLIDLNPVTIWRNEIVCIPELEVENDETKTVLYLFNVTTNEFKMFAIPRYGYSPTIFNYVESLVSVIGIEES